MKPVVLAILDGVGLRDETNGNAFKQASKPNFDYLMQKYPHSELQASGQAVGLPEGQMGNSEVGHLNIGAGRVVYQPLELINQAISDKSFYNNEELLKAMEHARAYNSKLHILGLLSDGGVHSHIDHIIALLRLCKIQNIKKVYLHCFMDGRDTLPDKALDYLKTLEMAIEEIGVGKIATISGRYYAMDRDKRWDRLKIAYDAIIYASGYKENNIKKIISDSFANNIYDEFIVPTIVDENGVIDNNDALVIANFRPDRIIQLGTALTNDKFSGFETKNITNLKLVTMMPTSIDVIGTYAFELPVINNTLGMYLSSLSMKQLRIAETEKYAHVTYFFDGGKDIQLNNCKRILIDSPKVATYDLKPEMSAYEVTNKLINELDNDYDLIILNYANCDMVGHTGNIKAAIKAVEAVDYNLGRIYNKIKEIGGLLIVTADHGNVDYMLDSEDNIVTAHSTSPVPFIVCDSNIQLYNGKLADIAPTILTLMNINCPLEMTGNILIV